MRMRVSEAVLHMTKQYLLCGSRSVGCLSAKGIAIVLLLSSGCDTTIDEKEVLPVVLQEAARRLDLAERDLSVGVFPRFLRETPEGLPSPGSSSEDFDGVMDAETTRAIHATTPLDVCEQTEVVACSELGSPGGLLMVTKPLAASDRRVSLYLQFVQWRGRLLDVQFWDVALVLGASGWEVTAFEPRGGEHAYLPR